MSDIAIINGLVTIDITNGYTGVTGSGDFVFNIGPINRQVTLSYPVQQQVLVLRAYRIQMKDADEALRARVLYIDLPFISSAQLIDTNPSVDYLPIELDDARVTLRDGLTRPLYLSKHIPQTFYVKVFTKDSAGNFTLETQINSLTLVFESSYSILK